MQTIETRTLALAVSAAFCLFVVQFWLCGVSVFPESSWFGEPAHVPYARAVVALNLRPLLMGAVPSALVAFCLARAVRSAGRRLSGSGNVGVLLLACWACVWLACWAALYAYFAGPDLARWSLSQFAQPAVWYGLVLGAVGLYLGARRERAARLQSHAS